MVQVHLEQPICLCGQTGKDICLRSRGAEGSNPSTGTIFIVLRDSVPVTHLVHTQGHVGSNPTLATILLCAG